MAILALNVRTEVAYGMSQDGCTAISWKTPSGASFLAQNWDWQEEQKPNLIKLTTSRRLDGKPAISMITEAGIIGKIGLNEKGVGVCLNAVGAIGVDFARLPVHLALRACLESKNVKEAEEKLKNYGVATACHILIMDKQQAIGLECSSLSVLSLHPDQRGILRHTNHYLEKHEGVIDKMTLRDSPERLARLDELLAKKIGENGKETVFSEEEIKSFLKDEKNSPMAICRSPTKDSSIATLFSVVMNLTDKKGEVVLGRPSQQGSEVILLDPQSDG